MPRSSLLTTRAATGADWSADGATRDTRGAARCAQCHEEWERERNAISPWIAEEPATVRVALSIADDGDPDVGPPDRAAQVATEILARYEAV